MFFEKKETKATKASMFYKVFYFFLFLNCFQLLVIV